MKTRYRRGTTASLNRLQLEAGSIGVDLERKAIRFWDGETLGGYEVLGERMVEPPPGPQTLLSGDLTTGFYGEVGPDDFISYEGLSTLVGLSAGTLHNQEESTWLKFSLDGGPVYVAKRTIRHSLSWNQLNAQDLVFGRTVEIGEFTYLIRLSTGLVDPDTYTAGGEWDRLILPVHQSDPTNQGWGIGYSDTDLNVGTVSGNGRASWVQETHPTQPTRRVNRGLSSVEALDSYTPSSTYANCGWRPILTPVV